MATIRVKVTQEHIDRGEKKNGGLRCMTCPLALALNEQLGGKWSVTQSYCANYDSENPRSFKVSPSARDFIAAVDSRYYDGSLVRAEPSEFDLEEVEVAA